MHRNIYLALVLLTFILTWPILHFLGKSSSKNYNRIAGMRRTIACLSSSMSGIFYKIRYDKEIDWNRNYIIVANHTSNLDITAVMKSCLTAFSFIGKDELLKNPVTGFFFRTIDIPVNRSSKVSSFRAFKRAQEYLLSGKSIAIFPEGGINDSFPPKLQVFKNGGFKLATDLNIPILPIVIEDAWKIHWDDAKKYGSKPGVVHIHVLEPIETNRHNISADDLRDITYGLFKNNLNS